MKTKKYKSHPLQSPEWAEFRKKMGVKIIEENGFILSIHKIPRTNWTIGYLPKGTMPSKEMLDKLQEIGKKEKCIFIQLEPNILKNHKSSIINHKSLVPSAHPLFTKYTFILDLTKSEEELLKGMHPKTRYNIKLAQKHGVETIKDNSNEAFETYLKLTRETTKRQGFYAHSENYHRIMWKTLPHKIINHKSSIINQLSSHLLLTKYQGKTLVAWIVFVFQDTLYYPYGASSSEHRETMASNLMMWEVIRFGKKLGLKKFDMWGALGPNPNPKDPWYGFHRFKQGYGGELVEFVGSYDLIINSMLYRLYKIADKIRWGLLKAIKRTV
jgi:lipid II:glycine glycyltransferase (peptidoglycan interpeptide bridge formation enzyme)